jgi:SAM-dependent methyltransferase
MGATRHEKGGQAEFWDTRYDREDYLFGTEPNDFLRVTAPSARADQTAICPADGEGRNGVHLAGLGYRVTSIDVSKLAVGKALKLAKTRGVAIDARTGDFFEQEWPSDAYDLVAVAFMHFPPPMIERFHQTLAALLKPGGLLLIEGYHIDQMGFETGGPKVPEMLFTRDRLAGHFEGLDILLLQDCRRQLSEGSRHRGKAATVQFVGRKPH